MKTERYQPDGAGFQFLCITSAEAISPQTGPVHPSAATAQFPLLPQPWLASPWHPDKCFAFRMSSTHHFCPQIQLRERLPSCPDAQAWHLCPAPGILTAAGKRPMFPAWPLRVSATALLLKVSVQIHPREPSFTVFISASTSK